jgi:hypothetical protein
MWKILKKRCRFGLNKKKAIREQSLIHKSLIILEEGWETGFEPATPRTTI